MVLHSKTWMEYCILRRSGVLYQSAGRSKRIFRLSPWLRENMISGGTLMTNGQMDQLCINTMRTLAMDAVQQADSGHPGTAMALAPVAYTVWNRFLRFDPDDPIWPNRDRFILSGGHVSTMLYSLLHLAQVKAVNPTYEIPGNPSLTLADLNPLRQPDSNWPS